MTTAEKIKAYRRSHGLSQTKFAEMAGYANRSTVAKIECGQVDLPLSKLEKMAEIFGVPVSDIVGDSHSNERLPLSPTEASIIRAYRSAPAEVQTAIQKMLLD